MGSGGGSSAPKDSAETKALTAQQTSMLKDIQSTVQQLDPSTFALMGMKQVDTPTLNPAYTAWEQKKAAYDQAVAQSLQKPTSGYTTAYNAISGGPWSNHHSDYIPNPGTAPTQYLSNSTWTPMTEAEKYAQLSGMDKNLYDLGTMQYQRLQDAYAGNLGISPALESDLAQQKAMIAETLAQKLGPNWMTSTPGIQAMSAFEQKANLIREEARRAMISEGQGLLLENLGYQGNTRQQQLSNLVNIPSARYQGNLSAGQGLLNSMIQRDATKAQYAASTQGPSKGVTALSGAATGAMAGASVGGVPGAIVGGVIGGIGGLLAG